jgi:hypothetical protein
MLKIANKMDAIKNIFQNKRVKSFFWSLGMMVLAYALNQASVMITDYGLATEYWITLGLIFAQISKMLNNISQGK